MRGAKVTVTATLDDAGAGWPVVPAGWTETSHDGDVGGVLRFRGVYAGVAGGSGDSGDVYAGEVTVPTVVPATVRGGLPMRRSAGSVDAGDRRLHGDGDGDGG